MSSPNPTPSSLRFRLLILDSGAGGLSILAEILSEIQHLGCLADIDYLADSAFCPYGDKTEDTISERVIELCTAAHYQENYDLIVIACNTASTIVLDALRAVLSTPVVGVVPAIKPAAVASASEPIIVLATTATIERSYTHKLAKEFAPEHNIIYLAGSELVDAIENAVLSSTPDHYWWIDEHPVSPWSSTQASSTRDELLNNALNLMVESISRKLQEEQSTPKRLIEAVLSESRTSPIEELENANSADSSPLQGAPYQLVLACTHFPLAKARIEKALHANPMTAKVNILDSGRAIALRVSRLLKDASRRDTVDSLRANDPATANKISADEKNDQPEKAVYRDESLPSIESEIDRPDSCEESEVKFSGEYLLCDTKIRCASTGSSEAAMRYLRFFERYIANCTSNTCSTTD